MQELSGEYRISIRSLLLRPDEKKTLSLEIDAETAASYGLPCVKLPKLEGLLENRAGVLMMNYRLSCVPALECDRCLAPVEMPVEAEFSHVIVTETASEQNDAEYLLAPDAMLDLAEVAMTDLRLSMPTKILCRPDCRGLCPVCGQNRNLADCGCDSGDITLSYQ
ncbi:MAG: DUF177 domain-containing protein [Oscillospiraceae bacterium]|nr:DUF177 domain-containing protein [Oscillospiraceae bacterium]